MDSFLNGLALNRDAKEAAKKYMAEKDISQLFESITAGLLHHRPLNPVDFVQDCLDSLKQQPDLVVKWNTFIDWTPSADSRTAASHNGLDDSSAIKEENDNKEEER